MFFDPVMQLEFVVDNSLKPGRRLVREPPEIWLLKKKQPLY